MDNYYKVVVKDCKTAKIGERLFIEGGFNTVILGRSVIFRCSVLKTNDFVDIMVKLNGYTSQVTDGDKQTFNEVHDKGTTHDY